MSKVKILVQWFNNLGELTELKDVERINVTRGESAKINKVDLFLKNPVETRGSDGKLYTRYVDSTSGLLKFSEGDTIKIYVAKMEDNRAISTTIESDDLVMSAEIKEVTPIVGEKESKIRLACVDKSYIMFNQLWSSTYTKDGKINTAPLIIQNVVRWASLNNEGKNGFNKEGVTAPGGWQVDARLDSEGGKIQTTRPGGSDFPARTIGKSFKPIYEWLDELSTTEFTNDFDGSDDRDSPTVDRTMVYYVDERNRFHWFYPSDSSTTTLNETITATQTVTTLTLTSSTGFDTKGSVQIGGEIFNYTGISSNTLTGVTRSAENSTAEAHASGDTVFSTLVLTQSDNDTGNIWLSSSFTFATFDVVNAVIFNAGDDMNGSGILGLFYDETSSSPQLKMVYKAWTYIARDLKKQELNIASDNNLTSITHTDADEYAFPANYTDYGAISKLPNWNPGDTSITTDDTFNTSLRNKAIDLGKGVAKDLTKGKSSARWKGKITMYFRRFTAGKLIRVNSSFSGIKDKDLRIKTVQYNITKDSARTTLTLEEDERRQGT